MKPRLLVVNQYHWPGVEATAHLLTELCEALTDEYEIRVLTGVLRGYEERPRRETRNGVDIVRVASTAFERASLGLRALNYASYIGSSLLAGLTGPRPDLVLCMTDPPMVGDVGLAVARRFGVPLLVISEDVFPEIATQLGRLDNPLLVGTLRQLIAFYLKRADRVVAIGDTMRRWPEAKGAPADRIRVIPNRVDTEAIAPQPRDNPWARANRLTGKFVVMHSGNVGHAQNLELLARASTFLRDLDDLAIVIIGAGARYLDLVHLAERLEADKMRSLPYQARDVLPMSLSSADLHFVGLAEGLAGFVVPSRLYGIMAAARPVLVAADAESETAQVVERVGCGIVVPPTRPELVAEVIRDAHDGRYDLEEMGARGRAYVEEDADTRVALGRYRAVLRELVQDGSLGLMRKIFWGSLAALAWTHAGYPAAAALAARLAPSRVRRNDVLPTVTVIVAAHDEDAVIARRVETFLQLDYPAELLEIVVASDASTDGTDAIVEKIAAREPRVTLLACPRGGKVAAQNLAVSRSEADVVAFSDANATWAPDALRLLVRAFADPDVAYVCGRLVLESADGTNVEGAYWKLETWLREQEAETGSITGGNGSIYAVRRADYVDVDARFGHDLSFPYLMVQRGRRAGYDPEALAFEKPTPDVEDEYRRKVRMFEHGWLMLHEGRMLTDLPPGYLVKLVSHRHLRYGSGVLHLALLGSSFVLAGRGGVYRLAWLGQLAFLAEAARRPGLARYYTLVTWGTVESLKNYVERGVPAVWDKAPGTR